MSHQKNSDDLLIDFDILKLDYSETISKQPSTVSTSLTIQNKKFENENKQSMPFMCSTVPIYKFLISDASNDAESNNPFDQMDKQAALLDDPFEIVENAVAHPIGRRIENSVETGTLISIDSPTNTRINTSDILHYNDKSKTKNANDAVQNISPISFSDQNRSTPRKTSPTAKSRGKTKNNSLILLKYSLSNSRSDMFSENGSPSFSDDNGSTEEKFQKKKTKITSRKDSTTDDSFDDIWATKPNLIDSQTDMDIESDVDSDLAKLNIPMLSTATGNENSAENSNTLPQEKKSAETKHSNRSELIEKLESIKLKNPSSPMQCSNSLNLGQLREQTVDMKPNQKLEFEDEPVTPKSHYSTMPQQHQVNPNNSEFLIKYLKNLVDQCDDINKQTAAKSLLDNLSSILDLNQKGENIKMKDEVELASYKPQPIKREGTFNLDKCGKEDNTEVTSEQSDTVPEAYVDDIPGLSQVLKQIQNVLGENPNFNVLQTSIQPISQVTAETSSAIQPANPTYIVVMAQPPLNINNGYILDDKDSFEQYPLRTRSQSLRLLERPVATSRASQNKVDQEMIAATPIRRLTLPRRSSFAAMIRPSFSKISDSRENTQIKSTTESKVETTSTLKRRTSLQLKTESQPVPQKNINLTRRRSFQEPSAFRIRSPSPKTSIQSFTTTGVGVTRRKLIQNEVSKDSPQKVKTLHSMMKRPPAPPAARNLKIRVTKTMTGRSTAPLRATVPINRVAPLLMGGEMVSPIEDYKAKSLITSTPRSILPSSTSALNMKKANTSTASLAESPIRKVIKDSFCSSALRSKETTETTQKAATQRRRTLSDYRVNAKTTNTPETGTSSTASNLKKATTALTNGLTRLANKRLSNIGINRTGSKENKHPE